MKSKLSAALAVAAAIMLAPAQGRADFQTPAQTTSEFGAIPAPGLPVSSSAPTALPSFFPTIQPFNTQNGTLTLTNIEITVTFQSGGSGTWTTTSPTGSTAPLIFLFTANGIVVAPVGLQLPGTFPSIGPGVQVPTGNASVRLAWHSRRTRAMVLRT
jgi:hypothetical protein